MAVSKQKKQELFKEVAALLKDSQSVVFVNFHALTVANVTTIRKDLKKQGVGYKVAKKRIAGKAITEAGVTGTMPELPGELSLVFGKDLIAPAREIYAFQKKLDNKVSILGGIFEGKFMTKEEMVSIASIPSQQTLYAQFVNLINSPIQGVVMALSQIAEKHGASAPAPEAAPVAAAA